MDLLTTHSGRVLHLGAGLTQQFRQILGQYCQDSEVRYTALLEESGSVCADAGDPALRDSGETAALAVGAYAALQAVAGRLGDSSFEGLFHEGKIRQFCLMPVTPQFMLLSVFEAPVRYAVVKMCATRAIARLQENIESMPISDSMPPAALTNSGAGAFNLETAALFRG
jgi:predicted regulator of Ras-like GTPase activity (Roadblock/LC7/MglB family)